MTQSFWDEPYRERHILMDRLSQHNRVVWINRFGRKREPLLPWRKKVKENLLVYYPGCKFIPDRLARLANDRRRLLQARIFLKRVDFLPDVVWTHDPYSIAFVEYYRRRGAITLYYCNDVFGEGKHRLVESRLARAVDLVLATSPNLYDRLIPYGETHLALHGVAEFEKGDFPYRKGRLETVGYVGTIRDCLDLELLKEIVRAGRYRLVMAGPVIEMDRLNEREKQDWHDFLHSPAVEYLGPLPLDRLRPVMARLDVLLMPYDVRFKGELSFPQKYFEYLSVGRPIVSTDFFTWPREYGRFVHVCRPGEDINKAVEQAFDSYTETLYREAVDLAHRSTWSRRLEQISSLIESKMAEQNPLKSGQTLI